ncbi:hypothetical protein F4679DRAFT_402641 [Xylaria curta]|nr:hypothetical protein F4679DRAFT_402641 [Xylaria curta]
MGICVNTYLCLARDSFSYSLSLCTVVGCWMAVVFAGGFALREAQHYLQTYLSRLVLFIFHFLACSKSLARLVFDIHVCHRLLILLVSWHVVMRDRVSKPPC